MKFVWIFLVLGMHMVCPEVLNRMGMGALLQEMPGVQLQTNTWQHGLRLAVPQAIPRIPTMSACQLAPLWPGLGMFNCRNGSCPHDLCAPVNNLFKVASELNRTIVTEIADTIEAIHTIIRDIVTSTGRQRTARSLPEDKPKVAPRINHVGKFTVSEIHHPASLERDKRAIGMLVAGLVGLVTGSLFSNSAGSDNKARQGVNELQDYVKDVDRRLEANTASEKKQYQMMVSVSRLLQRGLNATDLRVTTLERIIPIIIQSMRDMKEGVDKLINERLSTYGQRLFYNNVYTTYTIMITVQLPLALTQYLEYLREFLAGLQQLAVGELPSSVIFPKELAKILKIIKEHLIEELPGYNVGIPHLENLYHVPLLDVIYSNGYLYITLAIPITRQPSLYRVYQVRPYYRVAGPPQDQRYTLITNVPDYLAITGRYFVELSNEEYSQCVGDMSSRICFMSFLEHDFEQRTCALALYLNDMEAAQELCTVSYIVNKRPQDVIVPIGNSSLYIVSLADTRPWTLSCVGRRPVVHESCINCVVSLPCGCSLRTQHSYYPGALTGCAQYKSETTIEPPKYIKNLLYLMEMLGNTAKIQYTEPEQDTLTTNDTEAVGPHLNLENLMVKQARSDTSEVIIELKQLRYQIEEADREFHNATQSKGDLTLNKLPIEWENYVKWINMGLNILSILAAGYLYYKLQHTRAAVSALMVTRSRIPMVEALPVDGQEIQPSDNTTWMLVAILITTGVPFLWSIFMYLWKQYKHRNVLYHGISEQGEHVQAGRNTAVAIEFSNGVEYAQMFLQQVQGTPGQLQIMNMPTEIAGLPHFEYLPSTCLAAHIAINWKQIKLKDTYFCHEIQLATLVAIPWKQRPVTKRILSDKLVCRLLLGAPGTMEGLVIHVVPPSDVCGPEMPYIDPRIYPALPSEAEYPGECQSIEVQRSRSRMSYRNYSMRKLPRAPSAPPSEVMH